MKFSDLFDFGSQTKSQPESPTWALPDWAQNLPPEILQYIREGVGQQLSIPAEWGTSSDILNRLLNYNPQLSTYAEPAEYNQVSQMLNQLYNTPISNFQYPMEDIQKALAAQQALQLEQYQKQINPILADQGQYDSSYATNLLSDYIRGQQAESLGYTANLLTNQALQNYNLQQWFPQFQSGVASQIGSLGQMRSAINQGNVNLQNVYAMDWLPNYLQSLSNQYQSLGGLKQGTQQYNLEYPYQTYIPALSGMYSQGVNTADQQYQSALNSWAQDLNQWQAEQARNAAIKQLFYTAAGAAIGGPIGGAGGAALGASLGGQLGSFGGGSQPIVGLSQVGDLASTLKGLGLGGATTGGYTGYTGASGYSPMITNPYSNYYGTGASYYPGSTKYFQMSGLG